MRHFIVIGVLALAGCTLSTGSFAGKTCASNNDCPSPYVCAQVRPNERTCELVRGIDTVAPTPGAVVDYCNGAKAPLDRTCVSNCHGADTTGSRITTFRLDRYETVGSVAGAFDMRARIEARVDMDTMPPVADMVSPRPTAEERELIIAWVRSGGVECDAGTMGPADGGSDGGSADAGDGGQ